MGPPPRKGPLLLGVRGSLVPRVRQRQGGAEAEGGVPRCPHTCRDPSHLWKKGCLLPTPRHLSCLGPDAGNTGSPTGRSRQTGYASWSSPRQAEAEPRCSPRRKSEAGGQTPTPFWCLRGPLRPLAHPKTSSINQRGMHICGGPVHPDPAGGGGGPRSSGGVPPASP